MLAVVGSANSDTSTAVASLLSVNSIPQISYSATSPELSDKTRYPSFLRYSHITPLNMATNICVTPGVIRKSLLHYNLRDRNSFFYSKILFRLCC